MKKIKCILFFFTLSFMSSGQADTYDIDIETAISYDTNAYRAPGDSYVDFFADPEGLVTVNPTTHSGFFIPLDIDAYYDKKLNKKWRLLSELDLRSRTYLDNALSNADEQSYQARVGGKYKIHNFKKRKSSLYGGILLGNRDRVYYDRDTGEDKKASGGESINDLYSYKTEGFELRYDYWRKLKWDFKLGFRVEDRDYSSVPAGSEYDNRYTRLDLEYDYRLNKTFRLGLDFSKYSSDYLQRHSRNLSGQLFSSSPLLEYQYTDIGIFLKHRLSKDLSFRYGFEVLARRDQYVGYNDYDRTQLSVRARYHLNDRTLLRVKLAIKDQDYPNAWDFDRDPALYPDVTHTNHKSADGLDLNTTINYQWNEQTKLFAELDIKNSHNTDDRYDYERSTVMVGMKWSLQ